MSEKLPITYVPNPALAWIYDRLFDRIDIDEQWVERVREADRQGTVVYVLRNLSFVDFFALDYLTKRFHLPEVRFANDLGLGILEPFGRGWLKAIRPKRSGWDIEALRAAVRGGGSAAIFLKRPPTLLDPGVRGKREGDRFVQTLLELQRDSDKPILLVPQVFIWSKGPDVSNSLLDPIVGPREWPGKVRSLVQLAANFNHVTMRAGDPVNLKEVLTDEQAPEGTTARKVTSLLVRRLERERRAVLGPNYQSRDRMREHVVRSPKLQSVIRDLAGDGENERKLLEWKALSHLRELEADLDMGVIAAFGTTLDKVLPRLYSDIEVDRDGIERLRKLMKDHTVVFLPCHKSHIDYLVISYVLYTNHLQVPIIAAGDNLKFFPVGPMFRRAGAFFIRRSFKGDRLYIAVVDAYLRRLITDGRSLEFFIEGGRSRTGKLLSPKLGLLSVVVQAALDVPSRPLAFVPASISYERMVEENSYVKELSGAEKSKESVQGLVSSAGILSQRFGTISLQFGEALTLDGILEHQLGVDPTQRPLNPPLRRALIQRLAFRAMNEINRVTAVTSGGMVAMALLSHAGRGIDIRELQASVGRIARILQEGGSRFSRGVLSEDGSRVREESIRNACELFVRAGHVTVRLPGREVSKEQAPSVARQNHEVVFIVADEARMLLDLSKNPIVHVFVAKSLVAACVLQGSTEGNVAVEMELLKERVQFISRLFKHEFQFRADGTFDSNFAETIDAMVAEGALVRDGSRVHAGTEEGGERFFLYYEVLKNFFEAYRIAARAISQLQRGRLSAKEFTKHALSVGERMFLTGEISRREAISKPVLENASSAFFDLGYLTRLESKISLAPSFQGAEAASAIESRIAQLSTYRGAARSDRRLSERP